jgi:biopolymer transport protein ExbB
MNRSIVDTLIMYFEEGGAIMGPLVLATLVLWYALGYRYMTLLRGSSRSLYDVLADYETGRSKTPSGLIERVCALGISLSPRTQGSLRPVLDDAFAGTLRELKVGKSVIGSVVAAAPLLGLLGTVTGMIETFDSLADMSFHSQSGGIAGGIAEALFTTQMGLVVAVPGVILGKLLDRRETALEDEIERTKDYLCARKAEREQTL